MGVIGETRVAVMHVRGCIGEKGDTEGWMDRWMDANTLSAVTRRDRNAERETQAYLGFRGRCLIIAIRSGPKRSP